MGSLHHFCFLKMSNDAQRKFWLKDAQQSIKQRALTTFLHLPVDECGDR
jgi:hypothetical protein